MEKFATIRKRAAARKGGEQALEALMPELKSPAELRKIPDHRWLAESTKRIFQAGFVWKVIESKWDGFETVFEGFDPKTVANFSEGDIGRLLTDTRIIRNGQKIRAACHNAGFFLELAAEHGSAARFFADWPPADFVGLLETMKKRGSRLGGFTGQIFLRFMGKDSFIVNPDVTQALVAAGVVTGNPTSKRDLAAVQQAFNQWQHESGLPLGYIGRTLACSVGD